VIGLVIVTHGGWRRSSSTLWSMWSGRRRRWPPSASAPTTTWSAGARHSQGCQQVDVGDGVILLTDMFGGTPSNLAISVMEQTKAEVIAGLNLPMLIKLASVRTREPLGVLCQPRAGGPAANTSPSPPMSWPARSDGPRLRRNRQRTACTRGASARLSNSPALSMPTFTSPGRIRRLRRFRSWA